MSKKVARSSTSKPVKQTFLSHAHSGRLRPHKHTSYVSLVALLLLTMIPVTVASRAVAYAALDGSGDSRTYAVVPGASPDRAPTIDTIQNGSIRTNADPLTVRGSCQNDTMVRVFKNEILAGAVFCQNSAYSLPIDLFIGNNSLIARSFTATEAVSPDSETVSVLLQIPGAALGTSAPGGPGAPSNQFYLTSQVFYRGVNVNEPITWKLTAAGGQAPYAISIDWGDGTTELMSRGVAGPFDVTHTYKQPGGFQNSYKIIVKGSDQSGAKSFLEFVGIASGDKAALGVIGGVKQGYDSSTFIRIAWQVLGLSAAVVVAFFIGERRELHILKARHA